MSKAGTTNHPPKQENPAWPGWAVILKKLAIWGLFLACLYMTRDFFFMGFMTFIFSYLALAAVNWGMKRLSPNRDRGWFRRLLTVGVFALGLLALFVVGGLAAPRILAQGQRIAGWLSHVTPETETARILEGFVGPYQFRQKYGGVESADYRKDFQEFCKTGVRHVHEYQEFTNLQAWLEDGFDKYFTETQRARGREILLRDGVLSADFQKWFINEKVPALQETARKQISAADGPTSPGDSLVTLAVSLKPEELLNRVRQNQAQLATLRAEWIRATIDRDLATAKTSTAYQKEFREFFEEQKRSNPRGMPYTFEQYVTFQKARPQGMRAFGEALDRMMSPAQNEVESKLKAGFEASRKHELFEEWWTNSSPARIIRHQFDVGITSGGGIASKAEEIVSTIFDVPLSIITALLLSFFICIDFGTLKQGFRRLRETWVREIYDEIAPALSRLGQLVGLSMKAQGLIALCNATMVLIALSFLHVEHELFLTLIVFILCLVPTLGAVMACVLIAAFAMLQPGGGPVLALKVIGVFLIVGFVESFVLSPRILGSMMELHPVLIIALLPIAQYFFGLWGLILAIPVAVYVIHVVILGGDLPGTDVTSNRSDEQKSV